MRLRFFPFLIGRIEIADVTLVRPTIRVIFAHSGSSNWSGHVETLARALQPSPDRMASFSEIRIADGTVMLHDDASKVVETAHRRGVRARLAVDLEELRGDRAFRLARRGDRRDAEPDRLRRRADGRALRPQAPPRRGAAEIRLRRLYQPPAYAARWKGRSRPTPPRYATRCIGPAHWTTPGGGFGRFALKAQTNVVGGNIALSGVNIELDGNTGEGVLTFAGDGRQDPAGNAGRGPTRSHALRLHRPRCSPAATASGNRRLTVLDGLNGVDVDLRLSAARVTLANRQA